MAAALIAKAGAHYRAGEFDAAARCALEIVAQAPEHFDALHLLGVLCLNLGQSADAVNYLTRAALLRPDDPLLNVNLGNAWLALEQFSRAEDLSRGALPAHPNHLDILGNLAIALGHQNRRSDAIAAYRAMLAIRPDHAPAHYNMARSLEALGRLEEAEASYRAALRAAPEGTPPDRITDILTGLGGVLIERDRAGEVLDLFATEQSRWAEPLDLRWFESLLHLRMGHYEAGWRAYESRWQVAGHDKPHAGVIVPDITSIAGKRILVVGEQGRGDIVQFARYVPMLAERGATVTMSVYDDLTSLLSTLRGVARVIGEDSLEPAYDIVTHVLSLPLAFGTTVATVPNQVPYLQADRVRVAAWKARLGSGSVRHIGLAWSSTNPGLSRSTTLARLGALLDCPNTVFHALQREIDDVDLKFLQGNGRVVDHRAGLTDFAETAALIEALDLVISIDTAVAHIAGALGKAVWIMLPHVAEWRWLQNRTDSPWYPTARLYRQPAPGDWDGLTGQIVAALGT